MTLKYLPFAATLAVCGPAFGISVNMTDFTFGDPQTVVITDGSSEGPLETLAGEFFGTLSGSDSATTAGALALRRSASAVASSSFTAYCAELSQTFDFGTTYDYTWGAGAGYFGAAKYDALSRLFTGTQGLVTSSEVSAAVQAAIWEIIYETAPSYSLASGSFKVAPPAGASAATFAAFASVDGVLSHLSSYGALYSIRVLTNGTAQDFLVATAAVPEPGTWALLAGGLGVVGFMARRRRR